MSQSSFELYNASGIPVTPDSETLEIFDADGVKQVALDADAIATGIFDRDRIPGMAGAINGSNDGEAGIVPQPLDGQQFLYLDGGAGYSQPLGINHRQGFRISRLTDSVIQVTEGSIVVGDNLGGFTRAQSDISQTLNLATAGNWIGGSSTEAASSWISVYIDADGNLKLHNKLPSYGIDQTHRMTASVNQSGWNGTAGSGLNATAVVYDGDAGESNLRIGQLVGICDDTDTDYSLFRGKGSGAGVSVNNWSWARLLSFNTGSNTITLEAGHQIAINDNDRIVVIDNDILAYREESGVWYRWLGAIFNNASSNLTTNNNDFGSYTANEGADVTINTTTFTNILTAFNQTLLTNGGDISISFAATMAAAASTVVHIDFFVNGVALFGDDGSGLMTHLDIPSGGRKQVATPPMFIRYPLPGAHLIEPRWRRPSAVVVTMYLGAGTANLDAHPQCTMREVFHGAT